jgi:hypothetical protein
MGVVAEWVFSLGYCRFVISELEVLLEFDWVLEFLNLCCILVVLEAWFGPLELEVVGFLLGLYSYWFGGILVESEFGC